MRFLVHGRIDSAARAAMVRHGHVCHERAELSEDGDDGAADSPAVLLPLLEQRQWNLLTTDADLVRAVYETGLRFTGIIALLLETGEAPSDQAGAVERLFERYPRLAARRQYTVTRSRVKIRQLPGAGQA